MERSAYVVASAAESSGTMLIVGRSCNEADKCKISPFSEMMTPERPPMTGSPSTFCTKDTFLPDGTSCSLNGAKLEDWMKGAVSDMNLKAISLGVPSYTGLFPPAIVFGKIEFCFHLIDQLTGEFFWRVSNAESTEILPTAWVLTCTAE